MPKYPAHGPGILILENDGGRTTGLLSRSKGVPLGWHKKLLMRSFLMRNFLICYLSANPRCRSRADCPCTGAENTLYRKCTRVSAGILVAQATVGHQKYSYRQNARMHENSKNSVFTRTEIRPRASPATLRSGDRSTEYDE